MHITQLRILSILFTLLHLLVSPLTTRAENTPHEIGGFVLGTPISSYPGIFQSNYLKEVVVTDWHGFRKGVISYGTCVYDGQILKIDMKYKDKSKMFYKKLLKKFRNKFGAPDSWRGDSFGVIHIWKWHFIDTNQNRVSLALQFNAKNSNETIGNMIKLSFPGKLEEERLCFIRTCDKDTMKMDEKRRKERMKTDWKYLLPR